jgi:predicted MPP superfamily phosphohydrolase
VRWKGLNAWLNGLMIVVLMTVTGFSYNGAIAWQHQKTGQTPAPSIIQDVKHDLVAAFNPNKQAPLKFVAIGDTGSRLPGQYKTANALVKSYEAEPFSFVLLLGDNIYPYGDVKKHGDASFTQPYGPLLNAKVPFYVSLGNHDVQFGFRQDQLAFFHMPASYYVVKKGIADFFVIDTNEFDLKQQQWLYDQLQVSKAPWKIVFGHHPILSSGKHGNNKALMTSLSPILKEQNVALYLAGHDHNYERFKSQGGVTYVVSGGGGAALRSMDTVEPGSVKHQSVHHFVRFEATPKKLTARVIDSDLIVIDTFTLNH